MSIQSYTSPIDVKWNTDNQGNKISIPIDNEQHMVAQGFVTLNQIPDYVYHVEIDNMYEIEYGVPDATQFIVNYDMGIINFNEIHEAKTITIKQYYGRGMWKISSKRIFDDTGLPLDQSKSLQEYMDSLKSIQSEFDKFGSKGNYGSAISYDKFNIVIYNNDTYMSLQNNNLNHQPDISPTYWNLIAKSGDKGNSIHSKGTYSPIITYKNLDIVTYQNKVFMAKQDNLLNIIPTNNTFWELIMTNNDDYINAAYYYDSGIEINHGLNTYPDVLAITKNTFGHGGFGLFTMDSDYKVENTIEYIDSNKIKIYFVEEFSGIPTITKISDTQYSIQYSQEDCPIIIRLKV